MMNGRERILLGGLAHHVVPSHPIELVGSRSTMSRGKSNDVECKDEGE
ncbi:hypothetical protein RSAG8_07526, partial [Rhizoctonia solani AG-8 WAC10335]